MWICPMNYQRVICIGMKKYQKSRKQSATFVWDRSCCHYFLFLTTTESDLIVLKRIKVESSVLVRKIYEQNSPFKFWCCLKMMSKERSRSIYNETWQNWTGMDGWYSKFCTFRKNSLKICFVIERNSNFPLRNTFVKLFFFGQKY